MAVFDPKILLAKLDGDRCRWQSHSDLARNSEDRRSIPRRHAVKLEELTLGQSL